MPLLSDFSPMFRYGDKQSSTSTPSDDGHAVCQFSKESLDALDKRSEDAGLSWGSLSSNCGDSTPGLTDCSSRSSLQDLDTSILIDDDEDEGVDYESFQDALSSPASTASNTRIERCANREESLPYLPRVLRPQQPRSVSFSGIEEVFGADVESSPSLKQEESDSVPLPATPVIQWYTSGSSASSSSHSFQTFHKMLIAHPPLSSAPRRRPPQVRLQPRRSALKKAGGTGEGASLLFPTSPKVTWYASNKAR